MHESGIVDIQSHSLTHARIPVSPQVVDFLHPNFDVQLCRMGIPISSKDDPIRPERGLRLGAPVFDFAPRMTCRPRFIGATELDDAMTAYVEKNGGAAFFKRPNWRKELATVLNNWPTEKLGRFETSEEMVAAVRGELVESKQMLEARLAGKQVRHFCYPWFLGSDMSDCVAAQVGYRTVHYGAAPRMNRGQNSEMPPRIRRISEEYLFRLPGHGRWSLLSLSSIWINRIRKRG